MSKEDDYITPGAERRLKKYRRDAIIGFLILLIGIGGQQYLNSNSINDARSKADQHISSEAQKSRDAIVQSGRYVSVVGCNRDFGTIKKTRDLISGSRSQIKLYVKDGTLTQTQANRAYKQIADQLRKYPLPDCRGARTAITSDPSHIPPVPVPLYPGAPGS